MAQALGVDVSRYQEYGLDWQRIAAAGYSFAFLRYSVGDGTGVSGKDETFDHNLTEIRKTNMLVGAYHYLWSVNIAAQVALFTQLDPTLLDLPMAVDIEQTNISEADLKLFLSEIKRITGRRPIIYTRQTILDPILGNSSREWLKEYDFWLAEYPTEVGENPIRYPKGVTNWQFWQFTSTGNVPGHVGNIDTNYFNGTIDDLCCRYAHPKPVDTPLLWPVDSPVVTQAFGVNSEYYGPLLGAPGMGHEGIDFRAPTGSNVYACADGVIKVLSNSTSYGINVQIDHQNGLFTTYAHLQQSLVVIGQRVFAGQKIAIADNTGNSSGSHLHLTVKLERATAKGLTAYPNDIINPTSFLKNPAALPTVLLKPKATVTLNLNIRSTPEIVAGNVVGQLAPTGTIQGYPIAGEEWWKVRYNNADAYMKSEFLEVAEQAVLLRGTAQPYVNIRSSPSTSSTDIGNLNYGETIMGYPKIGEPFWRVVHNSSDAWIASEWLVVVQ